MDSARLFIVRYERFPQDETVEPKKQENILHTWYQTEADPVSTLVAKYNGSSDPSEVRIPYAILKFSECYQKC